MPTDSTSTIETSAPTASAAVTNASAPESSVSPVTSSSPVTDDDAETTSKPVAAVPTTPTLRIPSGDATRPSKRWRRMTTLASFSSSAMTRSTVRPEATLKSPALAASHACTAEAASAPWTSVARKPPDFTSACGVPKLFQVAEAPSAETASSCAWVGSTTAVRESKSGSCTVSSSRKTIARPPGGAARSARHAAPAAMSAQIALRPRNAGWSEMDIEVPPSGMG